MTDQNEIWEASNEACQIANDLDLAWCYVCGTPFFAVRPSITLREGPSEWTGNLREVDVAFAKEQGKGYCEAAQIFSPHCMSLVFFPLQRVLAVREAIQKAPEIVQDLVELHTQAHKAERGKLFMFAKGLELARRFFEPPQNDSNQRFHQEMVKIGMAPYLTRTVGWLFDMANNRFEIRHVVDRTKSSPAVHPRLSSFERRDFEYNADLVLRAFVCQHLGVDVIL